MTFFYVGFSRYPAIFIAIIVIVCTWSCHYRKSSLEKEVLTAVFYPPKGYHKKIRLKIVIQTQGKRKKGVNQGWTFLNRRFDLSPERGAEYSLVLNSRGQKVGAGLPALVVLDQDLAKGDYLIHVVLEFGSSDGYLTLFKLQAGQHEKRFLFRSQEFRP